MFKRKVTLIKTVVIIIEHGNLDSDEIADKAWLELNKTGSTLPTEYVTKIEKV